MKDKIIIIGTGYMSKIYYRHFRYLGQECFMAYRNKDSENYKNALNEFGNSSLLNIEEAKNLKVKILLSCVSPQNHLSSIEDFKKNAEIIAVEKPISLNIDEINKFDSKDSVFVLMNRRYYSWVSKIKKLVENNLIYKIVVNIPERNNKKLWNKIPISLVNNSIHIFDLIYYLCEGFEKPIFKKARKNSLFILTESKKVEEIFINCNYDFIENFSIKFYCNDNSIIECSPIEKASIFKNFEIIEPSKDDFIRKFKPKSHPFSEEQKFMEYQKPGILGICKDLVDFQKNKKRNEIRLPDINESLEIMMWLKNLNK